MYTVIKDFADLKDNGFVYHEGDKFPRDGFSVSDERLKELSGSNNKRGIPLIAEMITETVTEVGTVTKKRNKRR